MGQHADDILNGDVDQYTGEWLGDGSGFPRQSNKYSKSTREIRKELAILIKKTLKDSPDVKDNKIVEECRQQINIKYGKGWREQI